MEAMCGRVRLSTDYSETKIKVKFDAAYPAPNIPASWNVCPTDPMLVAVRSQDGKRIPQQMRWGLVPWWAKDIKVGFSSINRCYSAGPCVRSNMALSSAENSFDGPVPPLPPRFSDGDCA
jgi:putative SOS response-associated peptidase YedK